MVQLPQARPRAALGQGVIAHRRRAGEHEARPKPSALCSAVVPAEAQAALTVMISILITFNAATTCRKSRCLLLDDEPTQARGFIRLHAFAPENV